MYVIGGIPKKFKKKRGKKLIAPPVANTITLQGLKRAALKKVVQ